MTWELAEEARATLLELFPDGIEEREHDGSVELAAYTDAAGEARVRAAFEDVAASDVEEGWEERWREFHHGIAIGALWVGPPWEAAPKGLSAVVIEPGRAFGTGAHPTTRLCIELLAALPRGSLLDVGSGSGVLAVAAAKLGFAPVYAVDHDPVAVATTMDNARANGVEVDARETDALTGRLPQTAAAVANITLDGIRRVAPQLRSAHLVTSGYLAADRPALDRRQHLRRATRDGWAADVWAPAEE